MTEPDLRRALNRPESQRERKRWWARSSLCVEFDEQERVEFVEVTHDAELGWRVLYDQRDLLTVPADDAPAILHREQPRYDEDGHSLVCPTGLALWRPITPETQDDDATELEDDHQSGRCWRTVAVAAAGYWPSDPL
jgi:hypothetical protein